jgi:hypothetical protein
MEEKQAIIDKINELLDELTKVVPQDDSTPITEEAKSLFSKKNTELKSLNEKLKKIEDNEKIEMEMKSFNKFTPKTEMKSSEYVIGNLVNEELFIKDKRSITLGSYGESTYFQKIFSESIPTTNVLPQISISYDGVYGKLIPVFGNSYGQFTKVTNETGTTAANSNSITYKTLSVAPYISSTSISDPTLKLGAKYIENQIITAFKKDSIFKMNYEVIMGDTKGLVNNTNITSTVNTASSGSVSISDLNTLIFKQSGYYDISQLSIIINPVFLNAAMSTAKTHSDITYNNGYYWFNGVRIIQVGFMSSATGSTAIAAIVGNFENIALQLSEDLTIEKLSKTQGSLMNPIQSTVYFDYDVIVPSSFTKLLFK